MNTANCLFMSTSKLLVISSPQKVKHMFYRCGMIWGGGHVFYLLLLPSFLFHTSKLTIFSSNSWVSKCISHCVKPLIEQILFLWQHTCRSRGSGVCSSSSRTAILGQGQTQSTCFAHLPPNRCAYKLKSCKDTRASTWKSLIIHGKETM